MSNVLPSRILVTGGAGYIGSHTVVELIEQGYEPVIVDNLVNSKKVILDQVQRLTGKNILFYQVDCTDYDSFFRVFKEVDNIRGAIHFAAFKAVGDSVYFPLAYYRNNLDSLLVLLSLMQLFEVPDIIFSSSCTVYGQPAELPVDETASTVKPASPYGNTKKVCEEILQDCIGGTGHLRAVSLRYFNPIGAHPSGLIGELPIGKPNNLVPFIAQAASGIRDKLTVYGGDYSTPDGTCIRDYIHVVDLAKAHVKALEYAKAGNEKFNVFNLGTGKGNSVLEIINTFEQVNGVKVPYEIGDRREGDVEAVYAAVDKSVKYLNWKTEKSLGEALEHVWKWQQNLIKWNIDNL